MNKVAERSSIGSASEVGFAEVLQGHKQNKRKVLKKRARQQDNLFAVWKIFIK